MPVILALDQGTTSSRALVLSLPEGDTPLKLLGSHQLELPQFYPADGWVEHDAMDIWQHTELAMNQALKQANLGPQDIAAIGITNQRETTVLWDRTTGQPLHRAIVWQDRRTSDYCAKLRAEGREETLQRRTGLLADPYFSATKLRWLLDNVPDGQARAKRGELAFGTVDSWLIWNLTGGQVHATDATNASRTLLFNIHTQQWDPVLLDLFNIPASLLPEVKNSADDYGHTISGIPIRGVAGDQQSAAVGQACLSAGEVKSTYGTGCFMLLHTGDTAVPSTHRLLSTVALRLDDKTTYALEGSIFVAGAAVQWLRDGLHAIESSKEVEQLAQSVPDSGGIIMVPAFTGLGAPYWDADARGAILGLTRDTNLAHIARATLEAMGFQTRDLLEAMQADAESVNAALPAALKVDGGMTQNDFLMQMLADISERPVERPQQAESTALGAMWLAALGVGAIPNLDVIKAHWRCDKRFTPAPDKQLSESYFKRWKPAIARIRTDGEPHG